MKRPAKLVLLSWIVTAACTPSASNTPSPAYLGDFSVVQTGAARSVEPLRLPQAGVEMVDTLGVRIQGALSVRTPSSARFTASVENGTGRRYYYWWFVAACAKGGGCAPSSYTLLDEGEGTNAVTVRFGSESAEKDLVVQVAEIDGDGRTGSSTEFPVTGPARRLGGDGEGFASNVCDWYAGSFYPHTGKYTDPFSGRSRLRGFRRDYCGNKVSWDPQR